MICFLAGKKAHPHNSYYVNLPNAKYFAMGWQFPIFNYINIHIVNIYMVVN